MCVCGGGGGGGGACMAHVPEHKTFVMGAFLTLHVPSPISVFACLRQMKYISLDIVSVRFYRISLL